MIIVRRYVTLLELLIVIALLALMAGVMAIGIDKVLVDQRFRTEVSGLVDELRLAQDLMMIMDVDVRLKFKADDTGIDYWLELDTELPKDLLKQVQKVHRLRTIRGIFFENPSEEENTLDLDFLSKGAVMSKGILQLTISGEQEEKDSKILQNFICLPGYPRPISSTDTYEVAEKTCQLYEDETFAQTLTRDTFERLPEKLKNPSSKNQQESEGNSSAPENKSSEGSKTPAKDNKGKK